MSIVRFPGFTPSEMEHSIPCAYPIMFAVAVVSDAKLIVELGTGQGYSTDAFLKAVKITDGVLYSVDKSEDEPVATTRNQLKDEDRVIFVVGDSVDFAHKWDKGNIDILLCDSDHSYEHVSRELSSWGRFNPRIIFVHDTWNPRVRCAPFYAAKDYAEKMGKTFIDLKIRMGLGIII